jgi:hypothetical protein
LEKTTIIQGQFEDMSNIYKFKLEPWIF